jgi:signal transduction histidine kinase
MLTVFVRRAPFSWGAAAAVGLYRSAVLTGLTAAVPLPCAAVAYFGTGFALSWSARSHLPLVLQVIVTIGELAMGVVWTAVAGLLVLRIGGRTLSQAGRALAERWLGLRIEVRYPSPPAVTQMSTGFWWNGYEYHRTEAEARRQARLRQQGLLDPQFRRDALWTGVAAMTVLPSAALPLLALGVGLALRPGGWAWAVVLILVGLVIAPFAWRVFGPVASAFLGQSPRSRIEQLAAIQADMTTIQATELERIERSLHDGAQARIVALGMSMGTVEHLLGTDPEAARAVLADARVSASAALEELRTLVRGISPPVLAERGLTDAVRALALDAPVPVIVRGALAVRPERPVETAVYFAVSELLTNIAKHAHATVASIDLRHDGRVLHATVTDNGQGGADTMRGSGLNGIERRIAAFGGRLEVDSPAGGPTRITVAVPCALS